MRDVEAHSSMPRRGTWQAIRAIARTTVFQFVLTLLIAIALLLASPFANT